MVFFTRFTCLLHQKYHCSVNITILSKYSFCVARRAGNLESKDMANTDQQWELNEGVPQVEDPFIQKYLDGRDALIAEEHKQRHG